MRCSRRTILRATLRTTLGAGGIGPLAAALSGCGRDDPPTDGGPPEVDPSAAGALEDDESRARVPRPRVPRREPLLRVRIARGRVPHRAPIVLGSDDGALELTIFPDAGTAFAPRPPAMAVLRGPVTVARRGDVWTIRTADGPALEAEATMTVELRPPPPDADDITAVDGADHPGFIRLVPRDDGTCDIVNHVRMESYLPGVLARELYAQWPLETFAAQAIAARSFAASEHAYFSPRRHYDLTNTTASQAYIGLAGGPRAIEAVRMTRGQYLAWEDALVPGYYSACCGGTAADARDAIGAHPYNEIPPLRGHAGDDPCHDAPRYRWSRRRERAQLRASLRAWGAERGPAALGRMLQLRGIAPAERNEHGRPITYHLTALVAPAPPESPKSSEPSPPAEPGIAEEQVITVPAEALRRAIDYRPGSAAPDRLPSAHLAASFDGEALVLEGRGHGHGAGLCQYGARALADQGRDHRAILAWYYPGAAIVTSPG